MVGSVVMMTFMPAMFVFAVAVFAVIVFDMLGLMGIVARIAWALRVLVHRPLPFVEILFRVRRRVDKTVFAAAPRATASRWAK
jgi:hypothetical protein